MSEAKATSLFSLSQVGKTFNQAGVWGKKQKIEALRDINLEIKEGQSLGIVGESGSGKSTLVKILTGLITDYDGDIQFQGKPLPFWFKENRNAYCRKVQMVFQDPVSSLNPKRKIRSQLQTPLACLTQIPKEEKIGRIESVLKAVQLEKDVLDRYPHAFSGGQAQRISIARALVIEPSILILDEAVSALDVTVQAEILKLLRKLKDQFNLTLLFISHDLAVIHEVCDQSIVMKSGEIVESGETKELLRTPKTEYTKLLLESVYH